MHSIVSRVQLSRAAVVRPIPGDTLTISAPEAKDIRIAVDSAGTGFAVHISAKDAKTAEEVLRRARVLQGQIAEYPS